MTPEAQRIAIAEACGFTQIHQLQTVGGYRLVGQKREVFRGMNVQAEHDVPDYLSDLNAMHEAEMTLPSEGQWNFRETLKTRIGEDTAIHATAAQRAEALLRTIGKWVE